MGLIVLSGGEDVAGSVVFVGAIFSPRLWRLCEVCVGSGVGGIRAISKDWRVMSVH